VEDWVFSNSAGPGEVERHSALSRSPTRRFITEPDQRIGSAQKIRRLRADLLSSPVPLPPAVVSKKDIG
jgi:hypothetical protein